MSVQEIYKKYGDLIFRMTIQHIADVGCNNLTKNEIEKTVARIKAQGEQKGSLLSVSTQVSILECAKELLDCSFWDILTFVKSTLPLDCVEVTVGRIIQLRHNCTGNLIATLVAPSDTDPEDIAKVEEKLEDILEEYLKENNDDASGFDYIDSAIEAFKERGIKATTIAPHNVIYV